MSNEEWNKLYGEVVWAKFGSFPWWPSFIYDPAKLPTICSKDVRDKAVKLHMKQYVVYFYADATFGFASAKLVKPFNEETTAQFKGQKIVKGYQDSYAKAIELANEQIKLPASERVSWHYSNSSSADSEDENEGDGPADEAKGAGDVKDKQDKKRPKSRPTKKDNKPKKSAGQADLYFADDHELTAEDGAAELSAEDEDDEAEEEDVSVADEEEEVEEESAGSEYEKDDSPRRGGDRSRWHSAGSKSNKKRARGDTSPANAKRKRPAVQTQSTAEEEEEVVVSKGRSSASKPRTSVGGFAEETLVDRLTRFAGILKVCGGEGGDVARAVKVLDKLAQVAVTGADLVKSGVGLAIVALRKHGDTQISSRAAGLRTQWKAIVLQEQDGAKPSSVVTPVAASAAEPAPTKSPVPAARSTGSGTGTGTSDGAAGKSHPARARAVRLLREAVTEGRAAAAAREGGDGSGEGQAGTRPGDVAFAVEQAAMDSFGAGHPRYFECVTRLASRFKAGAAVEPVLALLEEGGISKCIELISHV